MLYLVCGEVHQTTYPCSAAGIREFWVESRMIGLVTFLTLIVLALRSRYRGDPWLIALLSGVRRSLAAVLAGFAIIVVLAIGLGVANAAFRPVADTAIGLLPEGHPPASRAGGELATLPTRKPETDRSTAALPTPTPRAVKLAFQASTSNEVSAPTPVSAAIEISPTSTPRPAAVTPTPTPESDRTGCDDAYPDERTCIPPGPPFDQGCAITAERRFTVLPPDPQGLDHDKDGIGCEPVN